MRIRSLKPEFWRSEDISRLDWETRLLFIGLWSYVDDNAVGIDRLADIAADLFALDVERDPSETFARVSGGLQTLSDNGLIVRYMVNGRRYLAVANFPKHQRIDKPNKARYPGPDQAERESVAEPSRDSRETPAPGAGEQGSRGAGEQTLLSTATRSTRDHTYPQDFEDFWSVYPIKQGKQAALKAWRQARRKVDNATLIAGAERYAADPNRSDTYTKHAQGWLTDGRWDDAPLPQRSDRKRTADDKASDFLRLASELGDARKEIGA